METKKKKGNEMNKKKLRRKWILTTMNNMIIKGQQVHQRNNYKVCQDYDKFACHKQPCSTTLKAVRLIEAVLFCEIKYLLAFT